MDLTAKGGYVQNSGYNNREVKSAKTDIAR